MSGFLIFVVIIGVLLVSSHIVSSSNEIESKTNLVSTLRENFSREASVKDNEIKNLKAQILLVENKFQGLVNLQGSESDLRYSIDEKKKAFSFLVDRFDSTQKSLRELQLEVTACSMNLRAFLHSNDQHNTCLNWVLANSQNRLLIVSGWMRTYVVNHLFALRIKAALARGVEVNIIFGSYDHDDMTEDSIEILRTTIGFHPRFTIRKTNTHVKLIICDSVIVVGSRNWLNAAESSASDLSVRFSDEPLADRLYSDFDTRKNFTLYQSGKP